MIAVEFEFGLNTHGISSIAFVAFDARVAGWSGKSRWTHQTRRSNVTWVALLPRGALVTR